MKVAVRFSRQAEPAGWLDRAGRLASWVSLAVALILLVMAWAGQLSPRLDVVAHLTSHLLGLSASAVVALLMARHQLLVLGAGIAVTIATHSALSLLGARDFPDDAYGVVRAGIAPSAFAPTSARAATAKDVRAPLNVISLNSWHSNKSPQALVAYLKRARADVVIMIEFGPSKLALLAQLKGDYPYQVHCATRWYCSLAMISRQPFIAAKAMAPSKTKPALIWARLSTSGVGARGGADSRIVTVIGTHIYRPSSKASLHATHLRELASFVNSIKTPYVLAGDFNATPWSHSYRQFLQDSGLKSSGRMLPSWPAWPLALPQFAIDHLFVSQELQVLHRGVGPQIGSDHLPIWASVGWR